MTKIKVELLDVMGTDLTIANVARVSFDKWKEEMDEKDVRLINYLASHEHTTPFRHAQVQVRCEAPIFIASQMKKHQVGMSWNEVSRRYVDTGVEFYKQEDWRKRPEGGIKQGSAEEVVETIEGAPTSDVIDAFNQRALFLYETLLAEGVAPELARQILPQSMMTSWVWTGSLMSFFHAYRLRIDNHAQREANDFAQKLKDAIYPHFPAAWEALENASK